MAPGLRGASEPSAPEDLERALSEVEVPSAAACARLAVAWEAADPDRARLWALRTVDGGADFTAWRSAASVLERLTARGSADDRRRLRVVVLGTSTTSALLPVLRLALAREGIDPVVTETPYGRYWPAALDASRLRASHDPDTAVLLPDHHALDLAGVVDDPVGWVAAEVERFTAPWRRLGEEGIHVLQISIVEPAGDPMGSAAAGWQGSSRARVRALNLALAEEAGRSGVGFVDAEVLAAGVGKERWFAPRYWYAARHAVSLAALPTLARAVAAAIVARSGGSRRCLVVDLDDTLWGGLVGEEGLGGITLAGPRGEAHRDFQRALVELAERGLVLAVCSRNDPKLAREPFEDHPDMVLRLEHLAAFDASWDPKPEGLVRIAESLGLGLGSMVLVDDDPVEREGVRQHLPEVDVLVLPDDPSAWRDLVLTYPRLDPGVLTEADRARTASYRTRAVTDALERHSATTADFHASLAMHARVASLGRTDATRAAQLLAKTNQFNLTQVRHPAEWIRAVEGDPRWWTLGARLRDRFADHGLVAVVIAEDHDGWFDVESMVMSCRVIGRGLDAVLMGELVDEARRRGRRLRAHYRPTDRNALVAALWEDLGMTEISRSPDGLRSYELEDPDGARVDAPITVKRSDT